MVPQALVFCFGAGACCGFCAAFCCRSRRAARCLPRSAREESGCASAPPADSWRVLFFCSLRCAGFPRFGCLYCYSRSDLRFVLVLPLCFTIRFLKKLFYILYDTPFSVSKTFVIVLGSEPILAARRFQGPGQPSGATTAALRRPPGLPSTRDFRCWRQIPPRRPFCILRPSGSGRLRPWCFPW